MVHAARNVLTTYLPLPFVPGFGDLLVSVAHHSDQHVNEQDCHDRHVQYKQQLQLIAIIVVTLFDRLHLTLFCMARVSHSLREKFVRLI